MIDIEIPEKNSYKIRRNKAFKTVAMWAFFLFLLALLLTDYYYALAVSIFFFIVQIISANNQNRFLITSLKILNDAVIIAYTDKENEHLFTGKLDKITFRKRFLIKRHRAVCLKISNEGELLLTQHEIAGWNEEKFDEIVHTCKQLKPN